MLFVLSGFLGIASYDALLNTADLTVAPGAAAFIMSTSPIFTAILATVFLREKLNPWGWLGSLFSLAGSGLIACGQPGGLAPDQGTCASPGVQSGVSREFGIECGACCCSMYWRRISSGAPPHDAAK